MSDFNSREPRNRSLVLSKTFSSGNEAIQTNPLKYNEETSLIQSHNGLKITQIRSKPQEIQNLDQKNNFLEQVHQNLRETLQISRDLLGETITSSFHTKPNEHEVLFLLESLKLN